MNWHSRGGFSRFVWSNDSQKGHSYKTRWKRVATVLENTQYIDECLASLEAAEMSMEINKSMEDPTWEPTKVAIDNAAQSENSMKFYSPTIFKYTELSNFIFIQIQMQNEKKYCLQWNKRLRVTIPFQYWLYYYLLTVAGILVKFCM